ncbi:MAG: universal stress protein [Burkholderiaceae bacterium]|nr:universal stress protein [Burkholderiaceae bacterium]
MPYKTILVHLDETVRCKERIRIAAGIANAEGAHLVGAAMIGVSTYSFQSSSASERDPNLVKHLEFLREKAARAVANFEKQVQQLGIASFEGRVVDGEAGEGMSLQARYCDLVVIGQTDLDEPTPSVAPDFPEYMVLHAGRPVLVIPSKGEFSHFGERALISWDASRGATRAVTDAIPLLRQANLVQLAVFNADSRRAEHGDRPGDDVALYLARHGVNIEVLQHQTSQDVGSALLALADELSSDLLVMGGYGHSRFRQMLLGGVTRTVLAGMTVPVIMSH